MTTKTMSHDQRAWAKLTPIQSSLTLSTPLGAPARMLLPPAKLISTYQIRGTKLPRLSGFMLGNRGGLAPKIDST